MKMKLNRALWFLIALTCLRLSSTSQAQTQAVPPRTERPKPPATEPAPSKKLDRFEASGLYLRAAVAKLQERLIEAEMPALNVLFTTNTEKVEIVSEVVLHNVSGPDALQFLATAAGCVVEPIASIDPAVHESVTTQQFRGVGRAVTGYVIRSQSQNRAGTGQIQIPTPPTAQARGGGLAQTASPSIVARVYPLGTVTTYSKFPDIETALRDILKTAGPTPEHQVKLAFHDKINLLVVSAPESVHVMVDQFLNALSRNAQEADRQNGAREVAQMRLEVEMATRAKVMLQDELSEKTAHIRELQKELMVLQGQKKP